MNILNIRNCCYGNIKNICALNILIIPKALSSELLKMCSRSSSNSEASASELLENLEHISSNSEVSAFGKKSYILLLRI